MREGILADLRVVEISAFVAAPLAGATLASLGAEVIRVEQLGGGPDAGRWPLHEGRSLYRAGLDQGKQSLAIDLRSERGQELATQLIRGDGERGGIVVSNLPATGWMAFERLVSVRPDLIMVLVTGTPDGGTAVDYTVNAGAGFPWITGPEEWTGPVNHVLPAWDITTAMLCTTALLAAERHRRLTGKGQLVKIALSDVALSVASHLGFLAEARLLETPRGRLGNYLYGSYAFDFSTADERQVMVCALTPRQWKSLLEATGLGAAFTELETALSLDLRREGERFEHRREISALLQPWFLERTLDEVSADFAGGGVLWGPYRTFKEMIREDPAASTPPASPIAFAAFDRPAALHAPEIGADTESVLEHLLGIDAMGLAALRQAGVIA